VADKEIETLETGVLSIKCNSWEDFIVKIRGQQPGLPVGSYIYRGQGDASWKLASQWERKVSYSLSLLPRDTNNDANAKERFSSSDEASIPIFADLRDGKLANFKRLAIELPGVNVDSNWDDNHWWALGRHHGLVTPILDWTTRPYVAAFFAFTHNLENVEKKPTTFDGFDEEEDVDLMYSSGGRFLFPHYPDGFSPVVIWALSTNVFDDDSVKNQFEFVGPAHQDFYHQIAQQGVFTRLTHGTRYDVESYLWSKDLGHFLVRYEIDGVEAGKALNDLEMMNITYATLFPDLTGIANESNIRPLIRWLRDGGIPVQVET